MASMPDAGTEVIGGVDTHKDFHVAAALSGIGEVLGTNRFPANRQGYQQLLSWLTDFGPATRIGVEGTGSYGAGLSRYLDTQGVEPVEVNRPNRQRRRRHGKSDATDAVAAARAVLSGEAEAKPRGGSGAVESIRMLKMARNGAVKARNAGCNQIRALIVTAPDELRAELGGLSIGRIVKLAAAYQPTDLGDPAEAARFTLKSLAGRHRNLTEEISALDQQLEPLVKKASPPGLLEMFGVGTQTVAQLLITAGSNPDRIRSEASFAALCGSSPVEASSGSTQRHRLNRGGDRQANSALYGIVIVRLRYHEPSRLYLERRLQGGKTKKEVIRCLKRLVAREVHSILTAPLAA